MSVETSSKPLSETHGARAIARLLVGAPVENLAGLPEPWGGLASQLAARGKGQTAAEVWEALIASRPDAPMLRQAVLAIAPDGTEPQATLGDMDSGTGGPGLPEVDIPALPKAARLSDALRDDCLGVGEWVRSYADYASRAAPMSPRSFHEMLGLIGVAVAIARRVRLCVSRYKIYPNLYALLVAPSTLYSKTSAFAILNQLLSEAGLERLLLPPRVTPESMLFEMTGRRPTDFDQWEKTDKDDWQRERAFAAQRAWLMEEAASLLDSFDQKYTQGLLSLVLDLYDCPERRQAQTIGRGRGTIRGAYLNICGPTTPAALKPHLANPLHWGNGLWPRFVLVTPDTPPVFKFWPPDVPASQALTDPLRVLALERLPMPKDDGWGNFETLAPLDVELEPGVWEHWEGYARGMWDLASNGVKERLRASYGRFATVTIKVAMLLATIDWAMWGGDRPKPLITLCHWARAQMFAEEWRASLHRLIERPGRDGEEEDLDEKVKRKLGGVPKGLAPYELARALGMTKDFERDQIDRVLQRMEQDGFVECAERKGERGPKAKVFRLVSSNGRNSES